jgi:predicted metal-dependent peptidase
MSFDKLTLQQRVTAANIDCMRNPQFGLLTGVIMMGKSEVSNTVPTAATNGRDKYYGAAFIEPMTRKQLRYLVLHENFHVALKHCTLYKAAVKKMPQLTNVAQDYVVNALIEELDPTFQFVERPTKELLIDRKYFGWSFPQVLRDLLDSGKQEPEPGEGGSGEGSDPGSSMDSHEPGDFDEPGDGKGEGDARLGKLVDDANRQGEIIAKRMRGEGKGGRDIFGLSSERTTNWVDALRDFIQTVCVGDEQSRFCPPNKRMLASGFVMPSHFTESIGEIIIACDTSGSMEPYYALIFGEVARICNNTKPEKVRVLWWDTKVCGDQEFSPDQFDSIAKLLKPRGGGGTTVSCVADYIDEKKYTPKCVVMVTDGYIESSYRVPKVPCLWGVVDNDHFQPLAGKTVRIKL